MNVGCLCAHGILFIAGILTVQAAPARVQHYDQRYQKALDILDDELSNKMSVRSPREDQHHAYWQGGKASTAQQDYCPYRGKSLSFINIAKPIFDAIIGISGDCNVQPGSVFRVVAKLIKRCSKDDDDEEMKAIFKQAYNRFQFFANLIDVFVKLGKEHIPKCEQKDVDIAVIKAFALPQANRESVVNNITQ